MTSISIGVSKWALVEEASATLAFLPPNLKQRLTPTIKMALEAAHICSGESKEMRSVFCSRYGEYNRTFKILNGLLDLGFVSPAAFSLSTHNVPSGVFAKNTDNHAPTTTISAHAETLEVGFLEAATQAKETGEPVLLLYVDEPLPVQYGEKYVGKRDSFALGMVLDNNAPMDVNLGWSGEGSVASPPSGVSSSARKVVQLLEKKQDQVTLDAGRLKWVWNVNSN